MPGTVRVDVFEASGLPVMDRLADTTDAFVECHFGGCSFKTDVCARSLHPSWTAAHPFVFEADDVELQDECLQFRVMDYDTYSANDPIGRVYLDLNPLVRAAYESDGDAPADADAASWQRTASVAGWLPILDSVSGHRGQLRVSVHLEIFADVNLRRESSCGVKIFSSDGVPLGYSLVGLRGFVDEILTADDPEYQWLDRIRSPRATNEARQTVLRRLNGQMARRLGRKAIAAGANALLGYRTMFDVEGEATNLVVIRGIATAALIASTTSSTAPPPAVRASSVMSETRAPLSESLWNRRRSRSRSTSSEDGSPRAWRAAAKAEPPLAAVAEVPSEPRAVELPLVTLGALPPSLWLATGGVVCARSVRMLADAQDKENIDAADVRDGWLVELRCEVKAHMKALACNAIIGYREEIAMRDGVYILSCYGTAVLVNTALWGVASMVESQPTDCSVCHVAYSDIALPFPAKLALCSACEAGSVFDLCLSTASASGYRCVTEEPFKPIQTIVTRKLQNSDPDEEQAVEISDLLPFVERQLHGELISALRHFGDHWNAVLEYRTTLAIGDGLLVAIATGVAASLSPILDAVCRPREPTRTASSQEEGSPAFNSARPPLDLNGDRDATCIALSRAEPAWTQQTSAAPTQRMSWGSVRDAIRKSASNAELVSRQFSLTPRSAASAAKQRAARIGFSVCPLPDFPDEDASCVDQPDKRRARYRIDRLVKKLRRRHQEKEDFVAALFLRQLCLQIGFVGQGGGDVESGVGGLLLHDVDTPELTVAASWPSVAAAHQQGVVDVVYIRETSNLKEMGGLDGFLNSVGEELLGALKHLARFHKAHAVVAPRISLSELTSSSARNQAQCLLGLTADVVAAAVNAPA